MEDWSSASTIWAPPSSSEIRPCMNIAWRAARVTDSQALAGEFADHRELDRRTESLTVNVHGPFVLDDMDVAHASPGGSA